MSFVGCVDKVKEYFIPKRFGVVAYVCVIAHFHAGLFIFGATVELSSREERKFSCSFADESTESYQKEVKQICLSKYHKTYETSLPLFQFVSLSFVCAITITFVYLLIVWRRVVEIELDLEQIDGEDKKTQNWKTGYVFYFYFAHLVLRSILGVVFTVLQHAYFYPNGFESKFNCILPSIKKNTQKITSRYVKSKSHFIQCENPTSFERWIWSILVSIVNITIGFFLLIEVVYLCKRGRIFEPRSTHSVAWSCDTGFVTEYFLRKPYELPEASDECMKFYKQAALNREKMTGLGDLYIDAVIQTERAPHRFSEDMDRGKIYETYTKVPENSILLEKIEDLFHPNIDTKDNVPLRILATGRPGIGKTSLAMKIIADWARETSEYYRDKIVFLFKFRLFKGKDWSNLTLKQFLHFGSGLEKRKFKSVYETVLERPSKTILIFDGLDEFHDNAIIYFEKSATIPRESDTRMSAMDLFIKLVMGDMLKGATVLVTSRPTADVFYSKINFDRDVEIIGFTSERIKKYVTRFCEDKGRSELTQVVWNHINSSSDVLNLCYVPVNCYIVCITLFAHDPGVELPTTMTELYRNALYRLKEEHCRVVGGDTSQKENQTMKPEELKKLEELAFRDVKLGQLVFEHESVDQQMEASGLLSKISHLASPTEYCFLHLTIQEFLAAKHISEIFAPAEIESFISDHVRSGKWHLVLQFIGGLLGRKMKISDTEFKGCFRAYAEHFEVVHDKIELNYNQVMIMKCLREVGDKRAIEDVCDTTILSDVKVISGVDNFSSSDWEAVTFVCRFMKNLGILDLAAMDENGLQEVMKLLQRRCITKLAFRDQQRSSKGYRCMMEQVFGALTKLDCKLTHKHANLTSLEISHCSLTGQCIPSLCKPLQSKLCNVTFLSLSSNKIGDRGAKTLFEDALTKENCQLTTLYLDSCDLTQRCVLSLCKALQSGHCKLTVLYLSQNVLDDNGVSMFFRNAFKKGNCKLTTLYLDCCYLRDQSTIDLCNALQEKHCQLTFLSLSCNGGANFSRLFEDGLTKEHCKLTTLYLASCPCSYTSKICNAIKEERCRLTFLSLSHNYIGDEGAIDLFQVGLANKYCKLSTLYLDFCSLSDRCLPSLSEALRNEHCKLTVLSLSYNSIGDEGVSRLCEEALTNEHCKLSELSLVRCGLTDQCSAYPV